MFGSIWEDLPREIVGVIDSHLDSPTRLSLSLASKRNRAHYFDIDSYDAYNTFYHALILGYVDLARYMVREGLQVAQPSSIVEDSAFESASRLFSALGSFNFGKISEYTNYSLYLVAERYAFRPSGSAVDALDRGLFVRGALSGGHDDLAQEIDSDIYKELYSLINDYRIGSSDGLDEDTAWRHARRWQEGAQELLKGALESGNIRNLRLIIDIYPYVIELGDLRSSYAAWNRGAVSRLLCEHEKTALRIPSLVSSHSTSWIEDLPEIEMCRGASELGYQFNSDDLYALLDGGYRRVGQNFSAPAIDFHISNQYRFECVKYLIEELGVCLKNSDRPEFVPCWATAEQMDYIFSHSGVSLTDIDQSVVFKTYVSTRFVADLSVVRYLVNNGAIVTSESVVQAVFLRNALPVLDILFERPLPDVWIEMVLSGVAMHVKTMSTGVGDAVIRTGLREEKARVRYHHLVRVLRFFLLKDLTTASILKEQFGEVKNRYFQAELARL